MIVALALGLWPRAPIPRTALAAGMCLAGLTALTALSLAWASDDGRAFTEVVRAMGYLGLFVAVVLASPRGGARPWLVGLCLGLTAVAVLAAGSRLQPNLFPEQELPLLLPEARPRLSYPLGYWNGLGACMAIGTVLLTWLAATAEQRWGRVAATAAIPLPALALFFTASRGGFVAAALGLAVLVAAGPRRPSLVAGLILGSAGAAVLIVKAAASDDLADGVLSAAADHQGDELLLMTLLVVLLVGALRFGVDARIQALQPGPAVRRAAFAATAVAGVVALIAISPLERIDSFADPPPPATLKKKAFTTGHLASATGSGRYQYWEAAWSAFKSEPLTGIGAGGYEAWWGEHASLPEFIRNAHSLVAENLAELGIAGLALVIAFLAIAAVAGVRARTTDSAATAGAALAVLAAGGGLAAGDRLWELPAAFAPTLLATALLTGPALARIPQRTGSRFGVGVVTLLTGWVAILAGAAAFATEAKLDDSRQSVDRGDLAAAVEDARDAGAVQPWASGPQLQEALVEELRGDLPAAESALQRAIDRAPKDWRVWLVEARLRARAGDVPGSLHATAQTNRLKPLEPLVERPGQL